MVAHKGTQEIRTSRLWLRRYRMQDANDIFTNYATDERVTKYLSWKPYAQIEQLQEFIASRISEYASNVYNWVIVYENQVIGSISTVRIDEKNESCEVGYCIGYEFWNMGITTEALSAVIHYLFAEVGFHRIIAKHDSENEASGKVIEKCKMTYEGRLREHYLRHDGSFSDSLLYSILKDEYCNSF